MTRSTSRSTGRQLALLLLGGSTLFACVCFAAAALAAGVFASGWTPLARGSAPTLGEAPQSLSDEQHAVHDAAAAFLQAWQTASWSKAFQLGSPAMQRDVRSAAELGTRIEETRSRPSAWRINRVGSVNATDTKADVRATGLFQGKSEPIYLQMERVGADWKVGGFRVTP